MDRLERAELARIAARQAGAGERALAALLLADQQRPRGLAEVIREAGWLAETGPKAVQPGSAQKAKAVCVWFDDWLYPAQLSARLEHPPPVLYVAGNLAHLRRPLFAIANSNGASEKALDATDRAAERLIVAGYLPVTGHNRVGYQRPALLAARWGHGCVTVLDRCLAEALGPELNRPLFGAARIWEPVFNGERELVITRFPMGCHGIGRNNRLRDELVFALAETIVVGELRRGGEMERRCREAEARGQTLIES